MISDHDDNSYQLIGIITFFDNLVKSRNSKEQLEYQNKSINNMSNNTKRTRKLANTEAKSATIKRLYQLRRSSSAAPLNSSTLPAKISSRSVARTIRLETSNDTLSDESNTTNPSQSSDRSSTRSMRSRSAATTSSTVSTTIQRKRKANNLNSDANDVQPTISSTNLSKTNTADSGINGRFRSGRNRAIKALPNVDGHENGDGALNRLNKRNRISNNNSNNQTINNNDKSNNNNNNNNDNIDGDLVNDRNIQIDGTASQDKLPKTKEKTKRARTKRRYICEFCNKEFLGGNDLRKHIRIHTDERPFECKHCGQKFRQGGCLKNHIASQHGTTETYTCYYCSKTFPIKERLRLHMRLHSGEKPYQCKICFKRFARGGQLTQHLASHSGIKKFHCTQCTASFTCSANLKLHLKSHSNVRDFTCHVCGKSFVRPDALKKHLSCYHENVKAFFCNICSRTFKGHLPQHMRTHENVKSHGCANCGATFSQKSQLIVHQRIHSGERPYRCQVCWQAFAHSSVLKLHIRKHTGEKPFKCSVCKHTETAFSQLPHLKTHMRAIHGMDKAYNCEYCSDYFKTKHELQEHKIKCAKAPKYAADVNEFGMYMEPKCSTKESTLSRMRLLIAVLLKKISSADKLKQLGFDKRLIDNVLMDALKVAGQQVCTDTNLHEVERLRENIKTFLDWSIPEAFMKKLKHTQRSTEELLEDLTSNCGREAQNA